MVRYLRSYWELSIQVLNPIAPCTVTETPP